jgi:hypothetical protein
MCFGEGGAADTLRDGDTTLIMNSAGRDLPAHAFSLRRNGDGVTWVVLDPHDPTHLRFTICRVDPCVMVMIEDPFARRQFRSVATVEDAMSFVRHAIEQVSAGNDLHRVLH